MENHIKCSICPQQQSFSRKDSLKRHIATVHKHHLCKRCGKAMSENCEHVGELVPKRRRLQDVTTTTAAANKIASISCCNRTFDSRRKYRGHLRSQQHSPNIQNLGEGVYSIKSSFKSRIASFKIVYDDGNKSDVRSFLENVKDRACKLIKDTVLQFTNVKLQLELFAFYAKFKDNQQQIDLKSFNTRYIILTESSDIEDDYNNLADIIRTKSSEFTDRDSGYALVNVSHLELNFCSYQPMQASTYIPLPASIATKTSCVNIKNKDNKCLAYSIVAALHPATMHVDRVSSYPAYESVLNLTGVEFPVKLKDLSKIETLNNISINVYGLEENPLDESVSVVGPVYYTKLKRDTHINLLYLEEGSKSHFVLIKNLTRLVSSQISKSHNRTDSLCDGCLISFPSNEALARHVENDCAKVYTILPSTKLKKSKTGYMTPENILKFVNYEKKMPVPFVIYADFECLLHPVPSSAELNDNSSSSTINTHKHIPYGFAYKIVCNFDENLNRFVSYNGLDAPKVFISRLVEDTKWIYNNYLKIVQPMNRLSADEQQMFDNATVCHICELPFNGDDDDTSKKKVADHCHMTAKFRGAAHSNCNLNFKIQKFIPIFFHNLSGYDLHLFVKDLAFDIENIDVIPLNKEKYISVSKHVLVDTYTDKMLNCERSVYLKIRFLDSFRFMSSSIDKLVRNLSPENMKHLRTHFPDDDKFKLLSRKGIFPYQYMNTFERLYEHSLPNKEQFFNSLTNSHVSDADYIHAQTVWNTFQCDTLADYSDIYLKTDVLLLADIFENFRKVCMNTYKLDPAHYFTTPGLSWDAMLKHTNVELELLTDIDMHHFVKNNIRGGLSQCSLRYSKANNKYMRDYNKKLPSSYLGYWDANNLYGFSMHQYLPMGGFKWLSPTEIENLDVSKVSDVSNTGYFLEVDIEYPATLHDHHNDLPFLPQSMPPPTSKFKHRKLLATLYNKSKYVIHYRNLNQAVRHGLKVTRVHRVLAFKQSDWLKSYIDLNTRLRTQAKNAFEKDYYKLMNNAVYGKTMENVDKRVDVRLVTHWDDIGHKRGAHHFIKKLNFRNVSVFDENLVAIQMQRLKVVQNKPCYIGFAVLELSKLHMYEFYYDFLKPTYRERVRLCYMDTDSFILQIHTNDIYRDMLENLSKFDTSNFPVDNLYSIPLQNKAVLGLFKDENAGKIQTEFIGLRSKMYCNRIDGYLLEKKVKGIKKNVIQHEIGFDDFKRCLFEEELVYRQQNLFRSKAHTIYSIKQNKLALSPHDDKRFIRKHDVDTYAWGHYSII